MREPGSKSCEHGVDSDARERVGVLTWRHPIAQADHAHAEHGDHEDAEDRLW